jgi:hypothetical protein
MSFGGGGFGGGFGGFGAPQQPAAPAFGQPAFGASAPAFGQPQQQVKFEDMFRCQPCNIRRPTTLIFFN